MGVAVKPICVAAEKYSKISRQAESAAALPRWHSSNNDKVEELRAELFVYVLVFFAARYCLIEREVYFIRLVCLPFLDFSHGRANGLKSLVRFDQREYSCLREKGCVFFARAFHSRQIFERL